MKAIGIFGGTFDPPHVGHLFIIRSLLKTLPFDEFKVIPTGIPPHRSPPIANASHRYKMTSLMVDSIRNTSVDQREIVREGPCYTVDTLSELRTHFGPNVSLALIVGIDAFSGFPSWRQPHKILDLARVIVIPRAGISLSQAKHSVQEILTVLEVDLKKRVYVSAITPPDISSTVIRQKILHGFDVKPFLPEKVWEYIKHRHLYS